MQLDPQCCLADLAAQIPAASRVFERFGLEYCCAGARTLSEACREHGLDPGVVLAALATEMDVRPRLSAQADLDALIDHVLERYHAPVRRELSELVAMARRVEARHRGRSDCPIELAAHLETMLGDLLDHLDKEEQLLFPMIRSGTSRVLFGPITVMQREHGEHQASLARIRELTADLTAPEGACATWRALYLRLAQFESDRMDHIHLENNVLFPRALRAT